MISIKSDDEIELMRKSGKITYDILMNLKDFIRPGITTKEIDKYVYDYITSHDATPSFLGYEGYPASACISINDVIVHGIPDDTRLKNGDIVTIDVGSIYKGYNSDSAYTYLVGDVDKKIIEFVENTKKALYEGIKQVKAGAKLNKVCSAIGKVAKDNGYGVFTCLTGHGVGLELHEDPYIPNYSNNESERIILEKGMTIAIEPMFSLGKKEVVLLDDDWTIVTRDGSPAAHFEHTILVTEDGYEILTGE